MKKQVKEWIVDKNLTTDSFDSIMIGVIYNCGHNTLDDPDVRKWIEMHPGEFMEMLPLNLNENQQMVLDELKVNTDYHKFNKFQAVYWMLTNFINYPDTLMAKAYKKLTQNELEQVFQVFSQWALEQEEE